MRTAIAIAAWSYALKDVTAKHRDEHVGFYFSLILLALFTMLLAFLEDLSSL